MVLTRRRLTTATATTPYKPLDEATPAKALMDSTNLRKNAPATAPVQRKNVGAPVTAPAQVDGPARRTRSTRKMAPSRKESPVCLTKQGMPKSVRRPRKNETEVVAPAAEEPVAPARPPAKTVTKPKKNVTFAAPPPPAQIYVRKRDAFAVFIVAVVAAAAGHYFGTLANAPPDVAAIAEDVAAIADPLFETTADLLGDALARARLATSVLRECLE